MTTATCSKHLQDSRHCKSLLTLCFASKLSTWLAWQDYNAEERQALAAKSRLAPPSFGNAERQEVSARLHQRMLELFPEVRFDGLLQPCLAVQPCLFAAAALPLLWCVQHMSKAITQRWCSVCILYAIHW